jgi:hypothetical protein
VPLWKSLLCNQHPKAKAATPKKSTAAESSTTLKKGLKGKEAGSAGRSLDAQATSFLLQATGADPVAEEDRHNASKRLGDRLASPLTEDLVAEVRTAFGLPAVGVLIR